MEALEVYRVASLKQTGILLLHEPIFAPISGNRRTQGMMKPHLIIFLKRTSRVFYCAASIVYDIFLLAINMFSHEVRLHCVRQHDANSILRWKRRAVRSQPPKRLVSVTELEQTNFSETYRVKAGLKRFSRYSLMQSVKFLGWKSGKGGFGKTDCFH